MQSHALVGSADPLNVTARCRLPAIHSEETWFPRYWRACAMCSPITPRRPSAASFASARAGAGSAATRVESAQTAPSNPRAPAPWWSIGGGAADWPLHGPQWFEAQSPNLFWPADRDWCVGSEIGFDSTLLGGTTELVNAILQAPQLDSWPIQPDDSLAHDADRLNPVP